MTREERGEVVKSLSELREAYRKYGGGEIHSYNNKLIAFDTAIDVLRGPVPDPETGLVPCRCGGKPREMMSKKGCYLQCDKCGARTGFTLWSQDRNLLWNHAMGYKEDA
jgi:hypothetical protein